MSKLIVRRELENFPTFGAWKWRKQDHDTPLKLRLSHAVAHIYLLEDFVPIKDEIIIFPRGRIEIVFEPAPEDVVRGLSGRGPSSMKAAETIYRTYVEAYGQFEALLYSAGKARNLMRFPPGSIADFFSGRGILRRSVEWSLNNSPFALFQPKLTKPRGRNPLFTAAQLVTPARWRDMQRSAENNSYPKGELFELYAIRGKLGWRDMQQTTVIEASIISETLLRAYGLKALKESGFSNTKLKRLRDEMTFNNLLNIVLPLSLTRRELRTVQPAIDAVDRLRGIRNDLVHGNIAASDVDISQIERGIDGAISLVRFLQSRVA